MSGISSSLHAISFAYLLRVAFLRVFDIFHVGPHILLVRLSVVVAATVLIVVIIVSIGTLTNLEIREVT